MKTVDIARAGIISLLPARPACSFREERPGAIPAAGIGSACDQDRIEIGHAARGEPVESRLDGLFVSRDRDLARAIEALRGVSLEAHDGDITCLLGPNGAGKTTLMMTIAGILRPRQGSILLNDENITGSSPGEIVARGIALVPENRLVFPEMSVRDNLIAGAYSRLASGKNQVLQDIDRLYQRFPTLKEREKQLAGTLSGGEQQMLAVARALMSKPRLLLMDEPSLGLAPLIVEEVFQIIRDLHDDGTSILLVEQNAHMALQVADRFCLLDQGRITFSGKPGQLSENELIRRAYLGGKQVG